MNTELGTRLKAIRERIVASGEPLKSWDELADELRRRQAGVFVGPDYNEICEILAARPCRSTPEDATD